MFEPSVSTSYRNIDRNLSETIRFLIARALNQHKKELDAFRSVTSPIISISVAKYIIAVLRVRDKKLCLESASKQPCFPAPSMPRQLCFIAQKYPTVTVCDPSISVALRFAEVQDARFSALSRDVSLPEAHRAPLHVPGP